MIYYYSATGNTRYAARFLGKVLNTETVNIIGQQKDDGRSELENSQQAAGKCYEAPKGEDIGLLFPIYCWGVPTVVSRFAERLFRHIGKERYVWMVCTCGDEAGTAMKSISRNLESIRGRGADALFSLIMPNTYVMLPGFDIDSREVEEAKLKAAPARLRDIALQIKERKEGVYDVTQGSLPSLRSAIFPIFEKWGVNTRWWKVSEACIGCGKCAARCPAANITMKEGRPQWGNDCYSCCACYHCCPVKAISYSRFTDNKGQYRIADLTDA